MRPIGVLIVGSLAAFSVSAWVLATRGRQVPGRVRKPLWIALLALGLPALLFGLTLASLAILSSIGEDSLGVGFNYGCFLMLIGGAPIFASWLLRRADNAS